MRFTAYILFGLIFIAPSLSAQDIHRRTLKLMGSRFDITVISDTKEKANSYIDRAVNEIERIEKLISSWDPNSQTSLVNKNAGISPVKVDKELFDLVERAVQISKLTKGAFDISYASMDRIWKFDGSMTTMPSAKAIKKSVERVGYQNIILDKKKSTIYLSQQGMKIGFGGIGKGYAADKAKKLLKDLGVSGGIINASGDMNTWGKQPSGKDWQVGIKNPLNKNKVFTLLPVYEKAVVTSGNYERFVKFNNKCYSHIIDPRTGYPSSGIVSVSVLSTSAELADALATSIFVMGKDVGLDFINQLNTIECIIVDDTGQVFYSNNINKTNKQTN